MFVTSDHSALKYLFTRKRQSKELWSLIVFRLPLPSSKRSVKFEVTIEVSKEFLERTVGETVLKTQAYWALKHANFDLKTAGNHRKLQLNELSELRDQAYENSLIYKEKTKKLHDSRKEPNLQCGEQVLLFPTPIKDLLPEAKSPDGSGPLQ
ncbi:hypothetical protein Tco_0628118 [Tanacetum coccineum]|uniref:Reverse transcriptase RNase H-like domain-containing protein n=1 Tax=Tanacetum coccineum TaxID=301880 RepID=A0ABQ4WPC6_9ASTR